MPLRPKYRARLKHMAPEQAIETLVKTIRHLEEIVLILFIALVMGAVAIWPIIIGRGARVDYVNNQIRNIWCTLIDGQPDSNDSRIPQIRHDYHCGPYKPRPGATPTSTPKPTTKPRPSVRPGAAGKPSPTPAPTPSAADPGALGRRPGTVTRSVTVTQSYTTTRTVRPTKSGQSTSFPALCPLPFICLPLDKLPF